MARPPKHWSLRLRALIKKIEPLGSFVHQSKLINVPQIMMPQITVSGIGRLGFPMLDVVINALTSKATKASYGHLDQTLTDIKVRDTWQIDATDVTIGGGEVWKSYFQETVRNHCFQLGISNKRFDTLKIQANLYKMLIYEEGGHFAKHRDIEKEVNMFGTLVLQLPTSEPFTGGEFTVTHQGVSKTLDMATASDTEFRTAAFYADCEHVIHPITRGQRVCLVYNLVVTSTKKSKKPLVLPSHLVNVETENELRLICTSWNEEGKVTKVGHQLEHKYSHQSFGVETLKGRDEIIFSTLRNAQSSSGARLFNISLLLEERYHSKDIMNDEEEFTSGPWKLIEANLDGTYKETMLRNKQDMYKKYAMVCLSKQGLWVMPGEHVHDGGPIPCAYDEDFDEELEDEYGNHVTDLDQMFLHPNVYKDDKEHSYNGNDGGHCESWYYAAAIVISPNCPLDMEPSAS